MFYSFLLYFLDSYHQGINIFKYLIKQNDLKQVKQNNDIIIYEDEDVSNERLQVNYNINTDVIFRIDIFL